MNNIFYMLLDDKLYACGEDDAYYIAEFTNGKWERTIPLPMISYDVRRRLTEEEAMILTSNVSVYELFEEITKEINFNNREKTEEELLIEFFEELVHIYKRNYFILKEDKPDFRYSAKELDEAYGGDLYKDLNSYYEDYLRLHTTLFTDLIITKTDDDFIIEFNK